MMMKSRRAADETRIRAVIDDWSNALRAKDAEGVVACQGPGFVEFSLAPPLVSTAADARGLEAWFDTWQGRIGCEIRDLSITAGDDTAFCHGLTRISGTKNDGSKPDIWFRLTLGFRKIGGEWKIAHVHESVPFHMDGSYRAAVELQP
jgi:ketosteroid isomerase-like protein